MGQGRRAAFAGFWGGFLAGTLDAGFALVHSWRGLGLGTSLHLLVIDAGLGAAAGAALALVFLGWSLGLERLLGRSRWISGGHGVALLLSSPVLVYDAFALFHGPQASRIPAHGLLSVLLIIVGVAAVWVAVTLWRWLLARAEPGASGGRASGSPGMLLGAGLALLAVAFALTWVNHNILPRLYHWFHLSLSLATLASCVLAVRLLLGTRRHVLDKRWTGILAAVAAVLLLAGVLVERPIFQGSQRLRFFVHERTQLASLFVRALQPRIPAASRPAAAPVAESSAPALPRGPIRPDSDVVLMTIDAVRADHVGCYGYPRATTPHLDAFAAEAVRFERAYTQAPHTSFALASLMIGKYYPTLARLGSSGRHETLAAILRRYGWKTAAFFPPAVFYIDAHKMKAFESSNFDFEYVKYEYLNAEARVGQIEEFLAAERPKKLFLWLHLFEPHEPYQEHPGFDFGGRDVDRYDSEIAYSDRVVGKVLSLLREKRPGAIVIVAADHGEEFGEHGGRYHGTALHEEQVRVPLLIHVPGLPARVVAGPAELIDIPATVLGLLDIPVSLRMRGTDLGPWLGPEPAPDHRLPPAFAEVEEKRMVVWGAEKLICDVARDYCNYFDLKTDPGEQRDQADQRPERVSILRQQLDAWLLRQGRYEAGSGGELGEAGELASAIERGRLADASAVPALATGLRSGAPVEARREAARLLAAVLPPRVAAKGELVTAAREPGDDELRAWAAIALLRLGETAVTGQVRALLAGPPGPAQASWRTHAALALAERSDRTGVSVLAEALDDCGSDVTLCKRVLAALGQLKDRAVLPALVAHLPFVQTRAETVVALANLEDPAAAGPLLRCLASGEYVPVRIAAAEGLGRLGGARVVQGLQRALAHETEEAVRAAVRAALARLGRKK
jgi:arylsulfatase A-like enzyme